MVSILSKGASTDLILIRKELPLGMLFVDVVLRSNLFPLQHSIQRRGAILDVLFHISEGFYFVSHHLIMASLVHFEEKVHRKKLQRLNTIPLLFPRLLCQILEHMGFPKEPQHEHHRICQERFTLDKRNQLVGYFAPPRAHTMVAPSEPPQTKQAQSTPIPIKLGELPTVDTVIATLEDASSPLEAPTTWSKDISLSYCIYILY